MGVGRETHIERGPTSLDGVGKGSDSGEKGAGRGNPYAHARWSESITPQIAGLEGRS